MISFFYAPFLIFLDVFEKTPPKIGRKDWFIYLKTKPNLYINNRKDDLIIEKKIMEFYVKNIARFKKRCFISC